MPQPAGFPLVRRLKSGVPFLRHWRAAIVVLCVAAASGCSSSDQDSTTDNQPAIAEPGTQGAARLLVTRSDGTEVPMPALAPYVWCGAFSEGTVDIATEAIHIYLWPGLDPGFEGDPAGWIIRAVLDDIELGEPVRLPTPGVDLSDIPPTSPGVDIFAVADLNDFASSAASSSGALVFESVPCAGGDETVSFSIDVVLGAEDVGPESIGIEGVFSGSLNEPPQRDIYRS